MNDCSSVKSEGIWGDVSKEVIGILDIVHRVHKVINIVCFLGINSNSDIVFFFHTLFIQVYNNFVKMYLL